MKEKIISATILAASIIILGLCLKGGIDNFINKDRRVTVKGKAEKEVMANKVVWELISVENGDYLPDLYEIINKKEQTIKKFLIRNGIKEDDIIINAPKVSDRKVNSYDEERNISRYSMRLNMCVSSKEVKQVLAVLKKQGELLKEGVALLPRNDYDNELPISFDYDGFSNDKPELMKTAILNAQKSAEQFAENSSSRLDKIITADQGYTTIETPDANLPYQKKIILITEVTYSLKD